MGKLMNDIVKKISDETGVAISAVKKIARDILNGRSFPSDGAFEEFLRQQVILGKNLGAL